MNARFFAPTLIAAFVSLWQIAAVAAGGGPGNDSFRSPVVLKAPLDLVTVVTGASNVDATVEPDESQNFDQATIWYAYTAPSEGFLTVTYDAQNDQGGVVKLEPWFDLTHPALFGAVRTASNGSGQLVLPLAAGDKVRLAFNSVGGTGVFNFSYSLARRGGFAFADAPQASGHGSLYTWIYNRHESSVAAITIKRYESTHGAASVDYQITDLTSTTADYSFPAQGTVNFAAGETSKTLSIPISDGAATVKFKLALLNPSIGCVILGDTITDFLGEPYQREVEVVLESASTAPTNDSFSSAILLNQTSQTLPLPAGVATLQVGEPNYSDRSVWYRWTAPTGGTLAGSAGTGSYQLPLILFTGNSLATLAAVPPSNTTVLPTAGHTSPTFNVTGGTQYYIAVLDDDGLGVSQHGGAYQLTYTFTALSTYYFAPATIYAVAPLKKPYEAAQLTVVRNDPRQLATVPFTTVDTTGVGIAVAGRDYTTTSGTLTFPAGVASQTITVPLAAHANKLGALQFQVQLTTAPTAIGPTLATVQIFEDSLSTLATAYSSYLAGKWFAGLSPVAPGAGEGNIRLETSRGGAFTGSLLIDGRVLPLKGTFTPARARSFGGPDQVTTSIDIPIRNGPVLRLTLISDQAAFIHTLAGEISDTTAHTVLASFEAWPGQSICSSPGLFTFGGNPDSNVPATLQAPIYGSVKTLSSGQFKLLAVLPDGTKASAGGALALSEPDDATPTRFHLPFVAKLPAKKGLLQGDLLVAPFTHYFFSTFATGDGDGRVRWIRPSVTGKNPVTGFTTAAQLYVSHAGSGSGSKVVLAGLPSSFSLLLSGADLPIGGFLFHVQIDSRNKLIVQPVNGAILKSFVFQGDSTFKGSLKLPSGSAVPFAGALFPNLPKGVGSFFRIGQAGSVLLTTP